MIKIEKLKEKDLNKILEIEKQSFTNPWSENQFKESLNKFYTIKKWFKIVGFIGIDLIQDEAHILHMAVHPAYRNRGIAKRLMEFAIKFPAKKWLLEVRATNTAAQKLYEKYGFKVINRRHKYYQDNDEDALIMGRVI